MISHSELDSMRWIGDPHADEAIADILGRGAPAPDRMQRVEALNAVVRTWQDNAGVANWRPGESVLPGMGPALQRYLSVASALPPWADPARIERAEKLFMEHGALSVTILFCASLPECYVVPDLAAVLQATGQLVARTEHRIRATGAMIFPVMMSGGLTRPDGAGLAQILKVRLIHATVRNLLLRGSPEEALAAMRANTAAIPPLGAIQPGDAMHTALHVHGWRLEACGVPNDQEELAYTLLTFSYVFLRSMKRLGIGFTREQEEDYLHIWNVAGHFLGIRRDLMVDSMEAASALFACLQARGRADWVRHGDAVDPRPALGAALMDAMKSVIPDGPFKSFPELLARRLMEPASIRDLALDGRVSFIARVLFRALMGTARVIDAAVRLVFPDFSISRLLTRAIGYRLTCALLMSQTRDLSVPDRLRPGIGTLIAGWGDDSRAPRWMNAIEDRLTTRGDWLARAQAARS